MPDIPTVEIAPPDGWLGCRAGMTRAQIMETLQQRGVQAQAYGEDTLTATADEWEMEFHLATDGSERCRQISVEGEAVCWNGEQFAGRRLDDALRRLAPIGPAVWTANDAIGTPFPEPGEEPAGPLADERLLEMGTLWLAERRLGLVICDGEVMGAVWREPQDFPTRFAGPLTEAQRELSRRPDLEDYLATQRLERLDLKTPPDRLAPVRTLLTVLLMAALVAVGVLGFKEMQQWNQAPTLTGKLAAIEQVPMKQFRDFLPPALRWVVPFSRAVMIDGYRIEFTDPAGKPEQVVLEGNEFYVPPREVGAEVEVVFVGGDPPRVKGPSRARDAAFIEYVPWVIALGAIYLVAQVALGLVKRLVKDRASAGRSPRSDHPLVERT